MDVAWRFSGVTSGGTWIVNFRQLAASCGEPNFSHLYEMAPTWQVQAISGKLLRMA
jgi:hypothetical protein